MTPKPRYEIRAQAESRHADVLIYGIVGRSWYEESVEAKAFREELMELDVDTLDVHISSPGGSVFDGIAIYNALVQHPAAVTTYNDSLAASIASLIFQAGSKRIAAPNSLTMIHLPWVCACGNEEDFTKVIDWLVQIKQIIANTYARRSDSTAEDFIEAMRAETLYNADACCEAGLCDEIGEDVEVADVATLDPAALMRLQESPDRLAAAMAAFGGGEDFSLELPDIFAAGRTLSVANQTKLEEARDKLNEVLDTVPQKGEQSDATDDAASSRDIPQTLEAERTAALIVRTLR